MSAPFPLFWHRYGNDRRGLAAVEALRGVGADALGGRPVQHGVELDLKWAAAAGGPLLYAHHGPTGRELLDAGAARRRAKRGDGGVILLDELCARAAAAALPLLIEVKRGHGSVEAAYQRLDAALRAHDLLDSTWLAASSLELLEHGARLLPELRRVWFGSLAPGAAPRLLHKPTTRIRSSLRRHGLVPPVAGSPVELICPLGLRAKSPAQHEARAVAARAVGLGYLPGRVTRVAALAALAAADHPGAFVYAAPEAWR